MLFSSSLVQFNILSDKILMTFLGKLLDGTTEEFGWLMYKNKGKMFRLTNDQAIDEDFFFLLFYLFFFPLMMMLKIRQ